MDYDVTIRVPATVEMVLRVKDQPNSRQAIINAHDLLSSQPVPANVTVVDIDADDPHLVGCDPIYNQPA